MHVPSLFHVIHKLQYILMKHGFILALTTKDRREEREGEWRGKGSGEGRRAEQSRAFTGPKNIV